MALDLLSPGWHGGVYFYPVLGTQAIPDAAEERPKAMAGLRWDRPNDYSVRSRICPYRLRAPLRYNNGFTAYQLIEQKVRIIDALIKMGAEIVSYNCEDYHR